MNFITIFYIIDKLTILIDFLLFPYEPIHPNTVIVVENNALILGIF